MFGKKKITKKQAIKKIEKLLKEYILAMLI